MTRRELVLLYQVRGAISLYLSWECERDARERDARTQMTND